METYDVEKIVEHKGKRNTKFRKYLWCATQDLG
jgi:hypothetical protein